tara:strand:- start:5399 stop:6451 length:1053 start_codon:yes stop_codon:yes gene_type:complete
MTLNLAEKITIVFCSILALTGIVLSIIFVVKESGTASTTTYGSNDDRENFEYQHLPDFLEIVENFNDKKKKVKKKTVKKKTVKIKFWNGRLGNNIIQTLQAVQYALKYNLDIVILPRRIFKGYQGYGKFLKGNEIYINSIIGKKNTKNVANDTFWYSIGGAKREDLDKYASKAVPYAKKIWSLPFSGVVVLGDDVLVMHIRGEDIFKKGWKNPNYVTPPLSYYQKIIDQGNWKQVKIISSDDTNPCLNVLVNQYNHVTWTRNTLEQDIGILMSAKNVATSFGTFAHSLITFSDNLEKLWQPSQNNQFYNIKLYRPDIEIETIDLDEYYRLQTPWEYTDEQKERMMNYKLI